MGLFDQVAGMAREALSGREGEAGGVGAVVQMLQGQGGVGVVLDRFRQSGLGGLTASWCGDGPNAPLSPDQLQQALGSGPAAEVAQKLGLDPAEAAGRISQALPQILDHLTPGGEPAEGGALVGGLARRFGEGAPA